MSKKKDALKKKFVQGMSIFIIFLLLIGVLLPAIFVIIDILS